MIYCASSSRLTVTREVKGHAELKQKWTTRRGSRQRLKVLLEEPESRTRVEDGKMHGRRGKPKRTPRVATTSLPQKCWAFRSDTSKTTCSGPSKTSSSIPKSKQDSTSANETTLCEAQPQTRLGTQPVATSIRYQRGTRGKSVGLCKAGSSRFDTMYACRSFSGLILATLFSTKRSFSALFATPDLPVTLRPFCLLPLIKEAVSQFATRLPETASCWNHHQLHNCLICRCHRVPKMLLRSKPPHLLRHQRLPTRNVSS